MRIKPGLAGGDQLIKLIFHEQGQVWIWFVSLMAHHRITAAHWLKFSSEWGDLEGDGGILFNLVRDLVRGWGNLV